MYGTLRPGASNADVLAGIAGRWTSGVLRGWRYGDGWHGYPGLVLDADAGPVEVDVLLADGLGAHLPRLDAFEGPGYRRVVATVVCEHGPVEAWVYVLAGPPTGPRAAE